MPQIKGKWQWVPNWHPLEANRVKGKSQQTKISIVGSNFHFVFVHFLFFENILQVGKEEKLTLLMIAAKTNNKEAIELLLGKHADPDVVVEVVNGEKNENYTALIYAIESGSYQTLPELYEVTNAELRFSFQKLADSDFEWEKDDSAFQRLKTAIKAKIENDNNLFDDFF